ncbi:hypothetical protein ACFX1S_041627 [Malus domestica]
MTTIFKSYDLWEMVQHGYELLEMEIDALEEDLTKKQIATLRENRMNDARVLGIIEGVVSDFIFPRIANEETAKATWDALQQEYRGDVKVRKVKLQSLRHDFEYTRMREDEPLNDYFSTLFDVVTQMKTFGEDLPNERIMQKLLISLTKPYDSIMSVIEETKDIDTLSVQDVLASLNAFDQRLERHADGATEKAFQSLNIGSSSHSNQHQSRPKKDWKEKKNKKWEGKSNREHKDNSGNNNGGGKSKPLCKYYDKAHFGECCFKGKPKCHKCNRFGQLQNDCKSNTTQQVNITNQVEEETNVFSAFSANVVKDNKVWYINSVCINHMTTHESLLTDIDTTFTGKVKMGNGNIVEAIGKCILIIEATLRKSCWYQV